MCRSSGQAFLNKRRAEGDVHFDDRSLLLSREGYSFRNSSVASLKLAAARVRRSGRSSSPRVYRSVQYLPLMRAAGLPEIYTNAEPLCIVLRCATRLSGRFEYM